MADRYLRATGNWNGPVWASTSSGTAGSAATPTASDDVYISNNSSFTVTLTADATCNSINQYATTKNGDKINLSNYKLTVNGNVECYSMQGSTIEGPNGTIEINGNAAEWRFIAASGSTVIVNASASKALWLGSFSYKDFFINLGVGVSTSVTVGISGSPTFRSLIIKSKNSQAHTIVMDWSASLIVDKLVLIGSSSTNRLTIKNTDDTWVSTIAAKNYNTSTSYGQFVALEYIDGTSWSKPYIGSNSIATNSFGWLLQDPPKISTLVDPLTTAPVSNPNWTVSGTVTQVNTGYGGGGYNLDDDDNGTRMVSTNTYDLTGDGLIFQATHNGRHSSKFGIIPFDDYTVLGSNHEINSYPELRVDAVFPGLADVQSSLTGTAPLTYFYKIKYDNGKIEQYIKPALLPELSFVKIREDTIDEALIKSVRISSQIAGYRGMVIESINILPGFPLVDSENYAGHGFEDKTNPAAVSPFPSSDTIKYKPYSDFESSIKLPKGTYYWRVRAKDPTGSDTWGDWSEVRSFEVKPDNGNFFAFFYP